VTFLRSDTPLFDFWCTFMTVVNWQKAKDVICYPLGAQ
jgi:hypothetical protein